MKGFFLKNKKINNHFILLSCKKILNCILSASSKRCFNAKITCLDLVTYMSLMCGLSNKCNYNNEREVGAVLCYLPNVCSNNLIKR